MNTNHNRIKIADLETNEPNKTLVTNDNGELTFNDIPEKNFKTINGESLIGDGDIVTGGGSQSLQEVLNTGNQAVNSTMTFYGSRPQNYLQTTASGVLIGEETGISSQLNPYEVSIQDYLNNRASLTSNKLTFWKNWIAGVQVVAPSNPTSLNIQTLQDKSGTIALLSDITGGGSQNLQQVLNVNNQAKSYLTLEDPNGEGYFFYSSGFLSVTDPNLSNQARLHKNYLFLLDGSFGNSVHDIHGIKSTFHSVLMGGSSQIELMPSDSGNASVLQTPITGTTNFIPIEINGVKADKYGKLTIPTGGGSQNLQQVLNTGNTARQNNGTITLLGEDKGGNPLTEISIQNSLGDKSASIELKSNDGTNEFVYLSGSGGDGSEEDPYKFTEIIVGKELVLHGERKIIKFEPTLLPGSAANKYFIPEKPGLGEDYYFAMRDDINLQNVLDNNGTAKDVELTLESDFSENKSQITPYFIASKKGASSATLSALYSKDNLALEQIDFGGLSLISSKAGVQISESIIVPNEESTADAFYSLSKNTEAGKLHTLATTEDIKMKPYTVATLPAGIIGDTAYVTDATNPTYLSTLTGGGTTVCPVFYNGNTWVSH